MAVTRLLLIAFLVVAALPHQGAPLPDDPACGEGGAASGLCVDPGISDGSVDLSGSEGFGSSDQGPGQNDTGSDGATRGDGGSADPRDIQDSLRCGETSLCRDTYGASPVPTITLADLASFSPTAPTIRTEPDGWALRGLPINAIADTAVNSHDGTLLDHPVTVRFTPHTYRWDWGDGTTTSTTTAGSTWEDVDLPRFSETATSHVYIERGTVTVTLHVDYSVEYQLDGDAWTSVTGTVNATSTDRIYVGTATTVIVPDDCNADPLGIGC
ncbi:hypothetical protein [Labedella endophytica]|uniref:PKD domain-containing protein n=1 Tax=Labedella endophytica TaxID=1523160 RepID=A0A3S0WV38_9MICO|nr:hypothetical protein [Labedella endophytica]RUQ97503.1 hypothetical protein ELQ94_15095 [Labedella endophytica]